jgi:DNA-binding response OmpR family regulator
MTEPVIFIVDTNPVHGNLVKYQLTINRYSGTWLFSSVEECLYRLRKQSPDFLITEYHLGNYSGKDLLRMALKISPRTRVLFFTSVEDAGLAESLLSEGAKDYVVKSARLESSISELVRNIEFLCSETLTNRE